MKAQDEFYIGYLPEAPAGLARWVRGRVVLLSVAGALLAALLASGQADFSTAEFEFGTVRSFQGTYEARPAPSLALQRPGGGASRALLTVFGKHGAGEEMEGFEGKAVTLDGTLIHFRDQLMIEVVAGSVRATPSGPETPSASPSAGEEVGLRTVRGEIVDSKCFLGVMKPGNLKVHRACATRCISGGVPPILLVRRADGSVEQTFLLTDESGGSVNSRVLDRVAEPLEITGQVLRYDDLYVLRSDPATYRRLHD